MKIRLRITNQKYEFSKIVIVRLANYPTQKVTKYFVKAKLISESGAEKNWGNGYTYRLDRRTSHHGGDQIHIKRKNKEWVYRSNGEKSEPTKYTFPATREVERIVRSIFDLGPRIKIESHVITASSKAIILEARIS